MKDKNRGQVEALSEASTANFVKMLLYNHQIEIPPVSFASFQLLDYLSKRIIRRRIKGGRKHK